MYIQYSTQLKYSTKIHVICVFSVQKKTSKGQAAPSWFVEIPPFVPEVKEDIGTALSGWYAVDGNQKSGEPKTSWGNGTSSHYLQGFIHPNGGCLGFLNHQQYKQHREGPSFFHRFFGFNL